jgi:hypothetical protein
VPVHLRLSVPEREKACWPAPVDTKCLHGIQSPCYICTALIAAPYACCSLLDLPLMKRREVCTDRLPLQQAVSDMLEVLCRYWKSTSRYPIPP